MAKLLLFGLLIVGIFLISCEIQKDVVKPITPEINEGKTFDIASSCEVNGLLVQSNGQYNFVSSDNQCQDYLV